MGELERLSEYFAKRNSTQDLLEADVIEVIAERLPEVEQEIRDLWKRYKIHMWCRHGQEVKDNGFRMVLVWLMAKGIV